MLLERNFLFFVDEIFDEEIDGKFDGKTDGKFDEKTHAEFCPNTEVSKPKNHPDFFSRNDFFLGNMLVFVVKF